jgi:hypothetical protein
VVAFGGTKSLLTGSSGPSQIPLDDHNQKKNNTVAVGHAVVVLSVMSELQLTLVVVVLAKRDRTTTSLGVI